MKRMEILLLCSEFNRERDSENLVETLRDLTAKEKKIQELSDEVEKVRGELKIQEDITALYKSQLQTFEKDTDPEKMTQAELISYHQALIEKMVAVSRASGKLLDKCVVCADRTRDIALGCGHIICSHCEPRINTCPFCTAKIDRNLKRKIYM